MTFLLQHQNREPISVGASERCSGLYVLGIPGMGKSTLLWNLIEQDLDNDNSVVFIDPHGQALIDVIRRSRYIRNYLGRNLYYLAPQSPLSQIYFAQNRFILLDPTHETHSFGINPLACSNVASLPARMDAYNKTYNVFHSIWKEEWGVWLELILQNLIPVFIENQGYTLAHAPLFLRDAAVRAQLLSNVRYAKSALDFWKHEYQPKQAESAVTRIRSLLINPYVADIVGQSRPTLDLSSHVGSGTFIGLYLPASLPIHIRRFIGTLFTSELSFAVSKRPVENPARNLSIYIDEFQHFTTDQFADLILEGRKYGCAITIAHQERQGQFADSKKIFSATAACANKVLFQITVADARELAPEFAKPSPTELRRERELVISEDPVGDLLRGHANPEIRQFVNSYIRVIQEKREDLKSQIEYQRLRRLDDMDEAGAFRLEDQALIAAGALYEKRMVPLSYAERAAARGRTHTERMLDAFERGEGLRLAVRSLNHFLTSIMHGEEAPGKESFSDFLVQKVAEMPGLTYEHKRLLKTYIRLKFGDRAFSRSLPFEALNNTSLYKSEVDYMRACIEAKRRCFCALADMASNKQREFFYAAALPDSYQNGKYINAQPNVVWQLLSEGGRESAFRTSSSLLINGERIARGPCSIERDENKQIKFYASGSEVIFSEYVIYVLFALAFLNEPVLALMEIVAKSNFDAPLDGRYGHPYWRLPDAVDIANRFFKTRPDWEKESAFAPYDLYPKIYNFFMKHRQGSFFGIVILMDMISRYWNKSVSYWDRSVSVLDRYLGPNFPSGVKSGDRWDAPMCGEDEWFAAYTAIRKMPDKIYKAQLTDAERQIIITECDRLLSGHPVKTVIDELAKFSVLLAKPDNHILHQGTQWTFKEYPTRTHAQMNDEMVYELTHLPQFTAYAKILHEKDGVRSVKVYKTNTAPMEDIKSENPQSFIEALGRTQLEEVYRPREAVEKEIEEKAGSWGRGEPPPSGGGGRSSPPPSSVTSKK